MARPRGYKPTPEQIAAMQEGRRKAREAKIAAGIPVRKSKLLSTVSTDKPIVRITGKEIDAFDFYTPLRDSLRSLGKYNLLDKIIKEITDKTYWKNPEWIENKLEGYVTLIRG